MLTCITPESRHNLYLPNIYEAKTNRGVFLPIYTSPPMHETLPRAVTHALVLLHGLKGDADEYFCQGLTRAVSVGMAKSSLIVAPWFSSQQINGDTWQRGGNKTAVSAFWKTPAWVHGGDASPEPKRYTTSFDALDVIVGALQGHTQLKAVTLAGFSAGAQLLLRWSFFSPAAANVRSIVGNPGSYLYLDETRPAQGCRLLTDTGTHHQCALFRPPTNVSLCPTFDNYKYGLDFSQTRRNLYVGAFQDDPRALARARAQFKSKDVRFLLGSEDVCNCNTAMYRNPQTTTCYPTGETTCAPNDFGGVFEGRGCCDTFPDATEENAMDSSCGALLQGSNRLQRGLNYKSYLHRRYGWRDDKFSIFEGGHNVDAFYASPRFVDWAYHSSGKVESGVSLVGVTFEEGASVGAAKSASAGSMQAASVVIEGRELEI